MFDALVQHRAVRDALAAKQAAAAAAAAVEEEARREAAERAASEARRKEAASRAAAEAAEQRRTDRAAAAALRRRRLFLGEVRDSGLRHLSQCRSSTHPCHPPVPQCEFKSSGQLPCTAAAHP